MKKILCFILTAFLVFLNMSVLEALMIHQTAIEQEFRQENLPPFNELMISWNADRPEKGKYLFYVSVKTNDWSPWLLYASWGSDGQTSYASNEKDAPARVYQDAVEVLAGNKATGFQIKIVSEDSAVLNRIHGLHIYMNSDKTQEAKQTIAYSSPVFLNVKGVSQMTLDHVRHTDLCSPTSTTAVVRYLSNNSEIDPINFAKRSWDSGFDIFGNWVFNVAQAAVELGPTWNCWVERLSGFDDIYQRLHRGTPVIVSVRGPLTGSAQAYRTGHLMAVIGFDSEQQKVITMDPAFPADAQTITFYDLSDFIQAWNRRGRVAYVYEKKIN